MPSPRLGYCLNIHPGETLPQVLSALRGPVARARALSTPTAPLPVGLYLAASAAREALASPAALDDLRTALADAGATVFTANAFPMGGFHAASVKRLVYFPPWADAARLDYTLDVARVLARLLPEGARASISTLPIAYRAHGDPRLDLAARHLASLAIELEDLARTTGRELALALEPEPLCVVERASELVAFLEREVFGNDVLRAEVSHALKVPGTRGEAILRSRLGACLDTAHHAVVFEPLEDALATYARAGVRVVKAQLSSALELAPASNPSGVSRLRGFDEPRYLHQTCAREASGHLHAFEDIPLAYEGAALRPEVAAAPLVRTHCHVPLAWAGDPALGTTRPLLEKALAAIAGATTDLEVETYTWSVLPVATRAAFGDDVSAMVAAELAWVRERLPR